MDVEQFRYWGKQVIDYICTYVTTVGDRRVTADVEPGFLNDLIPNEAPWKGEDFGEVFKDFDTKIMQGMVHWGHPKFFAYFPSANSFASILGDLMSSATGAIGFSWASCPSLTELEIKVCDWYGKALNLPEYFLSDTVGTNGGGILCTGASETHLVCLIAARARTINRLRGSRKHIHESVFLPKLVAYTSVEAHSSVEKAALIGLTRLRILETDEHDVFRGETLKTAMEKDIADGLTPFFVVATVGTTSQCAFDNLVEIGQVCRQYDSVWFHVDGAYAGSSFILPEMAPFKLGLELADSFNVNPNKLFCTVFDASVMWVKNKDELKASLTVNPLYLHYEKEDKAVDLRNFGITLSRRFRSLKLYSVFRTYGIEGLQKYIRNHKTLAKHFEQLVIADPRFEVMNDVHLGLVCFRLRKSEEVNQEFLARLNHSGTLHMTPAKSRGQYIIRFCVVYEHATEQLIDDAWIEIQQIAGELLESLQSKNVPEPRFSRRLSEKYSFTRHVPREIYENDLHYPTLKDAWQPIALLDDEENGA